MQTCKECAVEKPITAYEWQKNRPNPRKVCKKCRESHRDREKENIRHRAYQKERRLKYPDLVREIWERCNYGVAKSDFEYQECWICGSTKRLCIDHDHNTGEARGLLCTKCNFALGHFEDDLHRLSKAIEYLKDGPHFQLSRTKYA